MYKCEICGKEYKSIAERAACEAACSKKLEAEKAAERAKAASAREEEMRKRIHDSIENTEKLVKNYEDEFGSVPNLAKIFYEVGSKPTGARPSLRPSLWSWLLNL